MNLESVWNNPKATVDKFDAILGRGLCTGVGSRDGQMCIEAAICAVLDLPHGDDPVCVTPAVRAYKIRLNDSTRWVSAESRAEGLRALGLAQIGSAGVVDGTEFRKRLAERTIRVLIPDLFRRSTDKADMLAAADRCEREGTKEAATDATAAADATYATYAAAAAAADATYATYAAAADATYATYAAADAYAAAARFAGLSPEYYLRLSAKLALEVLIDLKSPGVALLHL
jgi:hypothetical protein